VVLGPGPLGLMSGAAGQAARRGLCGRHRAAADSPREQARLEAAAKLGCDLVVEAGHSTWPTRC